MFKFLKKVSQEMKKVTWPTGKEFPSYTITVVATVAFVAIFFAIVDQGITFILNMFFE